MASTSIDELLLCPITLEQFQDPVVAEDGHTYERRAILNWIDKFNATSPITRQRLKSTELRSNHLIKSVVDQQNNNSTKDAETTFPNESQCWYEGQMCNGVRHGHGTSTEQLKDQQNETIHYSGEWKFNKKHGQGTLYNTLLCYQYTGSFKLDEMSGHGIQLFDNGDRYEGDFLHNQKNGQGTFEYSTNSTSSSRLKKYVGEYKDDQRHGKGHGFYRNGDQYIGEWKFDKMNGYGCYMRVGSGGGDHKDNGLFKDDVLVRRNWCNVS